MDHICVDRFDDTFFGDDGSDQVVRGDGEGRGVGFDGNGRGAVTEEFDDSSAR